MALRFYLFVSLSQSCTNNSWAHMTSSMLLNIEQKSLISLSLRTDTTHKYEPHTSIHMQRIHDIHGWCVTCKFTTTFFVPESSQNIFSLHVTRYVENSFYTQRTTTINYRQELFVLFCLPAHTQTHATQRKVTVVVVAAVMGCSLVGAVQMQMWKKMEMMNSSTMCNAVLNFDLSFISYIKYFVHMKWNK